MIHFMNLIHLVYNFLWGDLITIPLPGGSSLGLSLLVLLLVPTAIYFTLRTGFFRKCCVSLLKSVIPSIGTVSPACRP